LEQANIQFEKKESLCELESQVNKEQLILCDDIQNTFLVIKYNNSQNIGIAYYNYGLTPDSLYSQDDKFLYLGFGKKFICIDICGNKIVNNENLQSVFYEFLCDSNKDYICVICELDVYCYCNNTQKWKMGFKDIVNDYSIIDDTKVLIVCEDGMEYLFSLEDGKILV
jgi:hypothetical protein